MAAQANVAGDLSWGAQLRAAILRGESLREVNSETARQLAARRPTTVPQEEIEHVKEQFGAANEQVLRDHAISHVLGALSRVKDADQLIFFGGTALSRTYLPSLRLSEDIDLITQGRRDDMAEAMEAAIGPGLRRSHGPVTWSPRLAATRGSETAVLRIGESLQIRMQLLSQDGYPDWPTQRHRLVQRYSDAPAATLTTLTPSAFVANKAAVWLDRRAPRDLYDLWAMGKHGYINHGAATLFERLGPTGTRPQAWMFDEAPPQAAWQEALDHQGLTRVTARQALREVKELWGSVESAE